MSVAEQSRAPGPRVSGAGGRGRPAVIQGGMSVGVSGWPLARAAARTGQLGVVSGVALDATPAARRPPAASRAEDQLSGGPKGLPRRDLGPQRPPARHGQAVETKQPENGGGE